MLRSSPPLDSQSLTERVRLLLRGQHRTLPALSDREAIDRLRPYGQGITAAPAICPLNQQRPTDADPGGARGELMFEGVSDSTG